MSLAELIKRGGIYRDIPGTVPGEVLSALVKAFPVFPSVRKEKLLEAVLEREALVPTAVGNGIALPHPRNPLISEEGGQFTALAFLENPVDWNALDGKPVDTLLFIVSSSAKGHLGTLSELTFFCRQEKFIRLLRERVPLEELLRFITEAEKNWN